MIKSNPNRRRADFSVCHYHREAVSKEHRDARRGTPTTQPEGSQEVRTPIGTTMPLTTSPMRTTPSRPTITTTSVIPSTSPANRTTPVETI